jgi:hypothetical protein
VRLIVMPQHLRHVAAGSLAPFGIFWATPQVGLKASTRIDGRPLDLSG